MNVLQSTNARLAETAAKGDVFKVGARVACHFSPTKPEGRWFLGTVIRGAATKLTVKHDDDAIEEYSVKEHQSELVVLINPKLPKSTRGFTTPQINKMRLVPVTVAPKKPSPPLAPKKPSPAVNVGLQWTMKARASRQIDFPITQEQYDATPWIGQPFSTGRRGPTGKAVYVGFNAEGLVTSLCPERDDLLFNKSISMSQNTYDDLYARISKLKSGPSLTYREFVNIQKRTRVALDNLASSRQANQTKALDVFQKLKNDLYNWRPGCGMRATIKFSNATSSKEIRGVDLRKMAIAIDGSGTKLRWIPLSYVENVFEGTASPRPTATRRAWYD